MSDILRFACGHCGKQLSVKPQHAGRSTRCPGCQHSVTVPHPDPAPSQPDNLNVLGVFAFHENAANASGVGKDTKSAFDAAALGAVQPVSNPAVVSWDDVISRPPSPPSLAQVPRQFGGVPRTAIIGGAALLVALGVFCGWYLLKPATDPAVEFKDLAKKFMEEVRQDFHGKEVTKREEDEIGNGRPRLKVSITMLRRNEVSEQYAIDVKKTDSLLTPFVGEIRFQIRSVPIKLVDFVYPGFERETMERLQLNTGGEWKPVVQKYTFEDGKWASGSESIRDVFDSKK